MFHNKAAIVPKDVEPKSIISGPSVYVRKKFSYIGHASTTYSVEHAISIMDYIGQRTESDDCLPFAVALVENGEMVAVSEDNGEFGAGDILASALKKVEGFNVLVCVSRHADGCFVTDMFQGEKHRAIKDACAKALDILYAQLVNNGDSSSPGEEEGAPLSEDLGEYYNDPETHSGGPNVPPAPYRYMGGNNTSTAVGVLSSASNNKKPISATRSKIERFRGQPDAL